jgi:hypothetical protein
MELSHPIFTLSKDETSIDSVAITLQLIYTATIKYKRPIKLRSLTSPS